MGFPRGHTKKMWKKTPESEAEKVAAEDERCAAIGNAFHTNAVAALLDHALSSMKLKLRKGTEAILKNSLEAQGALATRTAQEEDLGAASEGDVAYSTVHNVYRQDEPESDAESLHWGMASELRAAAAQATDVPADDSKLAAELVMAYIRRQEHRGSDVRLDIGSLCPEHINLLELRTILHTFERRLRREHFGDARALHLTDSQVALAVAVKGRSSSRAINRLLRRFAALQVGGGLYPLLAWIESELNPADEPSRRHAA